MGLRLDLEVVARDEVDIFEAVGVRDRDIVAVGAELDRVVLAEDFGGEGKVYREFMLNVAWVVFQ